MGRASPPSPPQASAPHWAGGGRQPPRTAPAPHATPSPESRLPVRSLWQQKKEQSGCQASLFPLVLVTVSRPRAGTLTRNPRLPVLRGAALRRPSSEPEKSLQNVVALRVAVSTVAHGRVRVSPHTWGHGRQADAAEAGGGWGGWQ